MSQLKFDLAEIIVTNRNELENDLIDDVSSVLSTEQWFADQKLASYYLEAFADFIVYKLQGLVIEHTNNEFINVVEIVDKPFVADVLGQEILTPNYWRNK